MSPLKNDIMINSGKDRCSPNASCVFNSDLRKVKKVIDTE